MVDFLIDGQTVHNTMMCVDCMYPCMSVSRRHTDIFYVLNKPFEGPCELLRLIGYRGKEVRYQIFLTHVEICRDW